MRIGVNWTSPHNTALIAKLCQTGDVDFCEVLIDNFLIYEPEVLRDTLPTSSCAFHIMNSHFLHRDLKELEDYAKRIKKFAQFLKPLYISDHIGVFCHNDRQLPFMQEVAYEDFFPLFKERALLWGDMLESFIYYENFPSFEIQPLSQVIFYRSIQEHLGDHLNILFDFSNAIIAKKNGCETADAWREIAKATPHYHVGGYQKAGDTPYYLDSHDQAISEETLSFLEDFSLVLDQKEHTLVVERDFNLDFHAWHHDIQNARGAVQHVSSR